MSGLHITEKLVTMIDIEGAGRLDPISVVLENFEPGKGRITIRCYAQSWALNAYWGAMGGRSVEDFLMDCHPEYVRDALVWGRQPVKKRDEAYFLRIVQAVQQALRQRASHGAKVAHDLARPTMSRFANADDYNAAMDEWIASGTKEQP